MITSELVSLYSYENLSLFEINVLIMGIGLRNTTVMEFCGVFLDENTIHIRFSFIPSHKLMSQFSSALQGHFIWTTNYNQVFASRTTVVSSITEIETLTESKMTRRIVFHGMSLTDMIRRWPSWTYATTAGTATDSDPSLRAACARSPGIPSGFI